MTISPITREQPLPEVGYGAYSTKPLRVYDIPDEPDEPAKRDDHSDDQIHHDHDSRYGAWAEQHDEDLYEERAPVFVDATGRRKRSLRRVGYVLAASCVAYTAMVGISIAGGSVGPNSLLPGLPLPPLPGLSQPEQKPSIPPARPRIKRPQPAQVVKPSALPTPKPSVSVKPSPSATPTPSTTPTTKPPVTPTPTPTPTGSTPTPTPTGSTPTPTGSTSASTAGNGR